MYHFIKVQFTDDPEKWSYVAFSYRFYFTPNKGTEAVKFAHGAEAYQEMKCLERKYPNRIFQVTGLEEDVNLTATIQHNPGS